MQLIKKFGLKKKLDTIFLLLSCIYPIITNITITCYDSLVCFIINSWNKEISFKKKLNY